MILTNKFIGIGTAAFICWQTLTFNFKEEGFSLASAQSKPSCERVIDKYKKRLKGEWFSRGCLAKFKPENIDEHQKYLQAFTCIKDFLEEYDEESCGREGLYSQSLDAMLKNLFVKDEVVGPWVRNILKKEGILDYRRQLDDLVISAEETQYKITTAKTLYLQETLSRRKELKEEVSSWTNYLKDLRVQAVFTIDQALFTRERPAGFTKELDGDIREGLAISYKTFQDIVSLNKYLTEKNWSQVYHAFKEWKNDQKSVYKTLLSVLEKGLASGLLAVEIHTGKWVTISYPDNQGKWQITQASREFAEDWGNNGENFYKRVERIDEIIKGVEKIDLNIAYFKRGGAEAKVVEKEGKRAEIKMKKCFAWEYDYEERVVGGVFRRIDKCGNDSGIKCSAGKTPKETFEALICSLEKEHFSSYRSLFALGGLENDQVSKFNWEDDLKACYKEKILGESGNKCINKTRANKFVEDLTKYKKNRYSSPIKSITDAKPILWSTLSGKRYAPVKKIELENGERVHFMGGSSNWKETWLILEEYEGYDYKFERTVPQ